MQKKILKDRHFRKENSFFGFKNCGKFSGNFKKFNALGPSIPLEEYEYKFSARFFKNSSENASPRQQLFHPKSVSSKKSSTPKNGSSPKIVSSSKKVSSLTNVLTRKNDLREKFD